MHRQYDMNINRSGSKDGDTSSSFVRIGLLFGSLALALGLVLVPVYMKHDSSRLIDTQYPASQSAAPMTAVGAHGGDGE